MELIPNKHWHRMVLRTTYDYLHERMHHPDAEKDLIDEMIHLLANTIPLMSNHMVEFDAQHNDGRLHIVTCELYPTRMTLLQHFSVAKRLPDLWVILSDFQMHQFHTLLNRFPKPKPKPTTTTDTIIPPQTTFSKIYHVFDFHHHK